MSIKSVKSVVRVRNIVLVVVVIAVIIVAAVFASHSIPAGAAAPINGAISSSINREIIYRDGIFINGKENIMQDEQIATGLINGSIIGLA